MPVVASDCLLTSLSVGWAKAFAESMQKLREPSRFGWDTVVSAGLAKPFSPPWSHAVSVAATAIVRHLSLMLANSWSEDSPPAELPRCCVESRRQISDLLRRCTAPAFARHPLRAYEAMDDFRQIDFVAIVGDRFARLISEALHDDSKCVFFCHGRRFIRVGH